MAAGLRTYYRTKKILADVSISSQIIRLLALLALFSEKMPLLSDNQAHDQTTTSATLSSVVICPLSVSQTQRVSQAQFQFNLVWMKKAIEFSLVIFLWLIAHLLLHYGKVLS